MAEPRYLELTDVPKVGECNVCEWRTVSLSETPAQSACLLHVIRDHPDIYESVTSKPARTLTLSEDLWLASVTERDV